MPSIKKELPRRSGEMISNRYAVKRFKSNQLMHEFLNKNDNSWSIIKDGHGNILDIKSGTYFTRPSRDFKTTEYINIKDMSL